MRYMLKCKCGSVDFDTRDMATDIEAYTCRRCGTVEFFDDCDNIKLVPITSANLGIDSTVVPNLQQQVWPPEAKAIWVDAKAVSYTDDVPDYYTLKAAEMFGVTYDEVTDIQRDTAKQRLMFDTYKGTSQYISIDPASQEDWYVDFSTSDGTCTLGGNWVMCNRDCNKCELYQDYLANKED